MFSAVHTAIGDTENSDPTTPCQVDIDVSRAEYGAALEWDAFEASMLSIEPVPRVVVCVGKHDIMLRYILQGEMFSRLVKSDKLIIRESMSPPSGGVTMSQILSHPGECSIDGAILELNWTERFHFLVSDDPDAYLRTVRRDRRNDRRALMAPIEDLL